MKKITLTIEELFVLQNELTEFLKTKMSVSKKFSLREIAKIVSDQTKVASDSRDELIKKYGEVEAEGSENFIVKPNTQNFKDFVKEWSQILKKEKELEFPKFEFEDFKDVETDVDLNILFKLK